MKMTTISLRIACLALAVAAGMRAQQANVQAPKAGSAENGKRIFTAYGCYQCHGYQGQGGGAGARLAPRPLPLAAMIAYVRKPTGVMPPVTAKVVSDAEIADIRAYLETVPAPPDVKSVKLLNQ
jgi:mono/diheme cytochrome c family protein